MTALHLTLRFLGPTPAERIPDVADIVGSVARAHRPFAVRLAGTGAFPAPDRPRTLWLAVAGGIADLETLAAALGVALSAAGWPPDDRPFRPHLTLARSDGVRAGPAVAHALERVAAETGFAVEFSADQMVLYESRTGMGAARYAALHEAGLSRLAPPE